MNKGATGKWLAFNRDEMWIVGLAACVALFFTQGMPLFDSDYSQWLAQADQGFGNLLIRILSPFTTEPQSWGYSDRPMQVFIYKILQTIFGYWSMGYYLVKSLFFGALCGYMFRWMCKWGVEKQTAQMSMAIFATSVGVLGSVMWHSDFGVYSQLVTVMVLFWALPHLDRGPANISVYQKGINKMPKDFTRFLITFFVCIYFGAKLRADVRLVPMILLCYLFFFKRSKFEVYAWPFGFTFLASLPWSTSFLKHLPPFVPGAAGYTGTTYGTFSMTRIFEVLFSGFFSIKTPPVSVMGGIGILMMLACIAYLVFKMSKEQISQPNEKWGFMIIWLCVSVMGCAMAAPNGQAYAARYSLIPMIPATFIVAMTFQAAMTEFSMWQWMKQAMMAAVVIQAGMHFYQASSLRKEVGYFAISMDKIYRMMETEHANAQLVFAPSLPILGYKTAAAPVITSRKTFKDSEGYGNPGNTYLVTSNSSLYPGLTVEMVATGCNGSLFDAIFPCVSTEGILLEKYIGEVPEVVQADQFDKQGNLAAAKQVMEGYFQRNPGNHGAAFVLGLYAYRAGDQAKMEEVYDTIGPFFMGHPSVVYNWGLAKYTRQKWTEAAKLFEKAYAMAPRDYAIGFNLADSLFKQGKKARALATLNELKQAHPSNKTLQDYYDNWSKQ